MEQHLRLVFVCWRRCSRRLRGSAGGGWFHPRPLKILLARVAAVESPPVLSFGSSARARSRASLFHTTGARGMLRSPRRTGCALVVPREAAAPARAFRP